MKSITMAFFVMFFTNACAQHHEGNHYERANQASQQALEKLDRD